MAFNDTIQEISKKTRKFFKQNGNKQKTPKICRRKTLLMVIFSIKRLVIRVQNLKAMSLFLLCSGRNKNA